MHIYSLIRTGDKLLAVDQHDVTNMSMEDVSNLILGPEGTEIKLIFSRPPLPPPLKPVKQVQPPKIAGVGMRLDIKKTTFQGASCTVHFVGSLNPEGAAFESGEEFWKICWMYYVKSLLN